MIREMGQVSYTIEEVNRMLRQREARKRRPIYIY